jgi:hypothetical protein
MSTLTQLACDEAFASLPSKPLPCRRGNVLDVRVRVQLEHLAESLQRERLP